MTRRFGIAALLLTLTSASAFAATMGGCSSSSSPAVSDNTSDAGDTTSDAAPTVDADNGAPSTVYPAPHPAIAQVQSFGGPVLTSPHVVPVFFPGDTYQAQLETYLQQLATNKDWAKSVGEYGVTNPLTIGASIVLADAPPKNITETDVDDMVKSVASGQAVLQAGSVAATPDENTIYALFYPTATIISEAAGYDSCQAFGGYHGDDTVTIGDGGAPVRFTYALVPRCPTFYEAEGLTGIDEVTAGLTHEIAEAVTDPFSETQAAYLAADYDHKIYAVVLAASEVSDMCSWEMPSTSKPAGLDFQTSRVWSNAAAAAGHDPCLPAPSDPYFATVPDLQDDVPIPEYGSYGADGKLVLGGTTKGLRVAVGETKTIDLVLYSDGPTSGPWTVSPQEITAAGQEPALTLSLDRSSGVNGEKLHLSITRVKPIQQGRGSHILLYSSIGTQTTTSRLSLAFAYVTQ